jgi:MscS family membrane protein
VRLRILPWFLLAGLLQAQTGAPPIADPLGRTSPQSAIYQFLEACHARDYSRASHYLDLRQMNPSDRAKNGQELSRQLEDLLDDTPFDIATLSREPQGDTSDGLGFNFERLDTFHVGGQTQDLQLEKVELKQGLRVWMVSAASIAMIPTAHQAITETAFEKHLPQPLVTFEILDTPVWRWIALILMGVAIWYLASTIARGLVAVLRRMTEAPGLRRPIRLALASVGFRLAMELAPPSSLLRLYIERGLQVAFALAVAWGLAVIIDLLTKRWGSRLDPRLAGMSYSVLPLVRQILRGIIFLFSLMWVVRAWGYDTTALLAGLGVGGIAIALAAQKTIENLFGGVSVIGDRPVLVGDVCHFGDRTGTIMHIGLRSTKIRTDDRTIVSVPNAQFSSITLENISARDKIWFHPTLSLRRNTTSEQLKNVLASCREVIVNHADVEHGKMPVRLVGMGTYSLDIEVNAYVTTTDYDRFLDIQQDLLLQLLQAVEHSGAALAVPWRQSQ